MSVMSVTVSMMRGMMMAGSLPMAPIRSADDGPEAIVDEARAGNRHVGVAPSPGYPDIVVTLRALR